MKSRYQLLSFFVFAAICTVAALLLEGAARDDSMLGRRAAMVEKRLAKLDQQMVDLVEDEELLDCLNHASFGCFEATGLEQLPFSFLLYRQDSLIYWNNNRSLPSANLLGDWEGIRAAKLKNGYYLIRSKLIGEDLHVLAMLPIRNQFQISNSYLRAEYNADLWLKEGYLLLLGEREGSIAVKAQNGKTMFYLAKGNIPIESSGSPWIYVLYLLGFISFFYLLYQIAAQLARLDHSLVGLLFLVASIASSRMIAINLGIPHFLNGLALFGTHYYASSGIAASLGDLLIILILAALPATYFFRHVQPKDWVYDQNWKKLALGTVSTFVVFLALRIAIDVFRSLVVDSSISFDVDNVFSLDFLSLAGLFCLLLILSIYFIVCRTLVRSWLTIDLNGKSRFIALAIGTVLYLLFDLGIGLSSALDRLLLLGLLFISFCELIRRQQIVSFSIVHMLLWVAFFAFLSAGLLLRFNTIKTSERAKVYAQRISKDQDPKMEYLFAEIKDGVAKDNFVRAFLSNPILNTKAQADNRLRQLYLSNVDKKYEINIIYVNALGKQLNTLSDEEIKPEDWDEIISIYGESTDDEDLFYIDRGGTDYFYLGKVKLTGEQGSGTVFLQFEPRSRQSNSVYPELLAEGEDDYLDFEKLDFGVYLNGVLRENSGDYPYPYYYPFDEEKQKRGEISELALEDVNASSKEVVDSEASENVKQEIAVNGVANTVVYDQAGREEEFELRKIDGYKHLLYRASPAKRVVISDKQDHQLRPISLFSYLFLFFLIVTLLVAFLRILTGIIVFRKPYWTVFANSLRSRIQALVIALILFSFMIIGIVTVVYFTNQYSSYHKGRLLRKTSTIQIDIAYRLSDNRGLASPELQKLEQAFENGSGLDLKEVADIHSMDINIYDRDGRLIRSSEPDIFDKDLVSRRINPSAFRKIRWGSATQIVQNERIGELRYLSAYLPVRGETGEVLAFINLPYFAKQRNLRAEIASFMVTLINVYVFLLVGAGLIALFISNSITSSLAKISSQFTKVRLRGNNEPIAWRSEDEIGMLVAEYNKMLAELERSADLLAISERESAWREMAKQVAHEIKNPLTPMRLSIQHLQRAQKDGRDDLGPITERMSKTLLEQIDNLTNIASEFSNFAKMPKPQAVEMDLCEVIHSVVNLFKENEEVKIEANLPDRQVVIMADKNQMIRVFNNLIKNALQAIPADIEGTIKVSLAEDAEQVRVKLADNGIGIPEGQKARVFVPNFTTKNSGMGLGLSMCKNIVESVDGKIWFESTEGVGTDFFLSFPSLKAEGETE